MKTRYILILIAAAGTGLIIRITINKLRAITEEEWFRDQFDGIILYNELIDELDDEV